MPLLAEVPHPCNCFRLDVYTRRLLNAREQTMKKPYWSGVFPAITTQMTKGGGLDLDGTARHADALIKSGITGLVFLGSLGENQSLTVEEKKAGRQSDGQGRRWPRDRPERSGGIER